MTKKDKTYNGVKISGKGACARDCIGDNYVRFGALLHGYLMSEFSTVQHDHDSVVDATIEECLKRTDVIEAGFLSHPISSFKGWVYACLKTRAGSRAIDVLKKSRKTVQIYQGGEVGDEETRVAHPHPIVYAPQEELVYMKQLLERFGRLPDEEVSALRFMIDGADVSEMCARVPFIRSLMRRARNSSPIEFAKEVADLRATLGGGI